MAVSLGPSRGRCLDESATRRAWKVHKSGNLRYVADCQYEQLTELWEAGAVRYADSHLDEIEVRASGWERILKCPQTDQLWLEDYPRSAEHGGGPVRLRRMPADPSTPHLP